MNSLHDFCLTCLSKPGLAHNLNDMIIENLKILEILKMLIPTLLENPEIPLPNCICNECVDKLVTAYTFQKQCLNSVENLYRRWKENFEVKMVKLEPEEIVLDEMKDENTQVKENHFDEIATYFMSADDKEGYAKKSMDSSAERGVHRETEEDNLSDKLNNKVSAPNIKISRERLHSDERPFKCELCDRGYFEFIGLQNHIEFKHKKSFDEEKKDETVEEHLKISSEKTDSREQVKNKLTDNEISNKQVKTNIPADNKEHLKTLLKEMEDEEFISIKETDNKESQETLHKNELNKEIIPINELQENCKLCNKTFENTHVLNLHYAKIHVQKRPYRCETCYVDFRTEERYKKHQKSHLYVKTTFSKDNTLNDFKATPYLCTICGKCLSCSSTLKRHVFNHTDGTPFQCSVCPKKFKNELLLSRHIKSHSKNYVCKICGKYLSSRASLSSHELTHTGEKPHKCDFCNKSFISSIKMKTHRKIHTGEKPYKCPYCDKSFSQSSGRCIHVKKLHPKEWSAVNREDKRMK